MGIRALQPREMQPGNLACNFPAQEMAPKPAPVMGAWPLLLGEPKRRE